MELVFKLPRDKPPFLGIIFEDAREAVTLNQDFVNFHKDSRYSISIEPVGRLVNLRLLSHEPYEVRFYHNLACDLRKMTEWLAAAQRSDMYNFSHLIKQFDHEVVVKTLQMNKLWVLKVSELKQAWMD